MTYLVIIFIIIVLNIYFESLFIIIFDFNFFNFLNIISFFNGLNITLDCIPFTTTICFVNSLK